MNTQNNSPILEAAEILGGISQLAKACGVSPQAAHKWVNTQVPATRCLQIEGLTGGKVTRYRLRHDLFGDAPGQ